eukprot:GILJ01000888.1.p1 GENE.GILJ01000888.1~~GILJ01000888.1.p1  ORF type:complete len:1111 (+),score=205.03 GILJ01000888.1:92-3424(+)
MKTRQVAPLLLSLILLQTAISVYAETHKVTHASTQQQKGKKEVLSRVSEQLSTAGLSENELKLFQEQEMRKIQQEVEMEDAKKMAQNRETSNNIQRSTFLLPSTPADIKPEALSATLASHIDGDVMSSSGSFNERSAASAKESKLLEEMRQSLMKDVMDGAPESASPRFRSVSDSRGVQLSTLDDYAVRHMDDDNAVTVSEHSDTPEPGQTCHFELEPLNCVQRSDCGWCWLTPSRCVAGATEGPLLTGSGTQSSCPGFINGLPAYIHTVIELQNWDPSYSNRGPPTPSELKQALDTGAAVYSPYMGKDVVMGQHKLPVLMRTMNALQGMNDLQNQAQNPLMNGLARTTGMPFATPMGGANPAFNPMLTPTMSPVSALGNGGLMGHMAMNQLGFNSPMNQFGAFPGGGMNPMMAQAAGFGNNNGFNGMNMMSALSGYPSAMGSLVAGQPYQPSYEGKVSQASYCGMFTSNPHTCTKIPLCGWCQETALCIPGTAVGPSGAFCNIKSYVYEPYDGWDPYSRRFKQINSNSATVTHEDQSDYSEVGDGGLNIAIGHHPHFSYQSSDPHGPDNWGDLSPQWADCKPFQPSAGNEDLDQPIRKQSPINIVTNGPAKNVVNSQPWKEPLELFYEPLETVTMVHNGYNVQFNVPREHLGSLFDGTDGYELTRFNFHSPSEHTIDGKQFPLELHLIHESKLRRGHYAILAILFEQGTNENEFIAEFLADMPPPPVLETIELAENRTVDMVENRRNGPQTKVAHGSPLADLIKELIPYYAYNGYYTYEGSLTTPPCSEVAKWFIMNNVLEASSKQIRVFRDLLPVGGNARPVQNAHWTPGTLQVLYHPNPAPQPGSASATTKPMVGALNPTTNMQSYATLLNANDPLYMTSGPTLMNGQYPHTNPFATSSRMPTLRPCRSFSLNPTVCMSQSRCGWCQATSSCVQGNQNGPELGSCPPKYFVYSMRNDFDPFYGAKQQVLNNPMMVSRVPQGMPLRFAEQQPVDDSMLPAAADMSGMGPLPVPNEAPVEPLASGDGMFVPSPQQQIVDTETADVEETVQTADGAMEASPFRFMRVPDSTATHVVSAPRVDKHSARKQKLKKLLKQAEHLEEDLADLTQ